MAKINFKLQIMITVVMVTAGFVLSSLCRKEIFYNLRGFFADFCLRQIPFTRKIFPAQILLILKKEYASRD